MSARERQSKEPLHRSPEDGAHNRSAGGGLYPVLVALMQWGDRWLCANGKPSVALVEGKTGKSIAPIEVKTKAGDALTFHDVRFAQGLSATSNTHRVIEQRNGRVLGDATP